MLDTKMILALNGADDMFLEETACKLGYLETSNERITDMNEHRKRSSRRFFAILIAATMLLSLSAAAYATDFFGLRALLIEDEELFVPYENGAYVSITQPQEVPDEMNSDIKVKIENSTKAWEEWCAWSKENTIQRPAVFDPPEGFEFGEYREEIIDNGDSSYTIVFYKGTPLFDENGRFAGVDEEEIERRTASKEEVEQEQAYSEAMAKGYDGYDFKYNVYSQEMADKLEEIAASYGLKLRHESTLMLEDFGQFPGANSFDEMISKINEVCASGNSFFRTLPTGFDKFYYYDEGTFAVSFYTTEDRTNLGTSCYLYNSPYGTLSSGFEIVGLVKDIDAMSSYTHTAPDGTELTVMHNGADMFAYVYLDNSFVTLTFHQTNGLTVNEINSIIDMVDFSTIY